MVQRKIKIGIIATFMGQKTSGAEISGFLLAKNLGKKNDVFLITTKITKNMPFKAYSLSLTKALPNLVLLIGNGLIDFYMSKRIFAILKKEKPDIIHIQDPSMLVASITAAKKLKIPTVFTVRDYRFACNLSKCLEKNEIMFNCDKNQYKKCLYSSFEDAYSMGWIIPIIFPWFYSQNKRLLSYFKNIDHYITVSDFVKEQLALSGIKKDKITTIKVQKEEWEPIKIKAKNQIFTAGGLKKTKGFDFLIESFKIVVDSHPKIKLRIAGEGSYKKSLEEMVKKFGLSKNIEFLGNINHDQMKKEYAESLFVISPSLWPEPLSRIIFEAFTMRKTIVATDVGGTSELVIDEKTGLLVKPFDKEAMARAIISLIKDPKKRVILENNAYSIINKEANSKINYDMHLKAYMGLLNKK